MTGEVYGLLSSHGLIAKCIQNSALNDRAFEAGCQQSTKDGGLLHHIFSTRARYACGELSAHETGSYLSGLLLSHEIKEQDIQGSVALVGAKNLLETYQKAFRFHGKESETYSGEQATAQGLYNIWRHIQ